ncbi:MAG: SMC-Scp complex subunit ScpB [Deltaproteobacteria bacterium]|jgi:segregation and condensation protein B|nr:SMC-Scp complex subunit ScpB [Deltaproteobacteria bacterium]
MPSLRTILEGLLFVSDAPLGAELLCEIAAGPHSTEDVRRELESMREEYDAGERAFTLRQVAGGWQLRTKAGLAPWCHKLKRTAPAKLSKAAVETLAVVAYRQPILRAEIEKIRGVDAGGIIRTLLDKDLVRISARRETLPGRPMLYSTTQKFLETFELKSIDSLPTVEEMDKIRPPVVQPKLF